MIRDIRFYCNHDSCIYDGECEHCQSQVTVERTYTDEIKVILPCGYKQRFWADITDSEAINRCEKMKEQGIDLKKDNLKR